MFLAVYKRFNKTEFSDHETIEEARSFLDYGYDEGELFRIAIYDIPAKNIVWSNDIIPLKKENIERCCSEALELYELENK